MPSWPQLISQFEQRPTDAAKTEWVTREMQSALDAISALRGDSNVVIYASAFLQKPQAPAPLVQLTLEELNGCMAAIHGVDFTKGLTLILHTPGGVTNAAEAIVAYLRSKFPKLEVIVPTYAMSAGTMISLAADRIIMGKQSQLGPIDPQLHVPSTGRFVSARAVVDQFNQAKQEIQENMVAAHAWAPVLQSLGPGLLQEARNALDYGEEMVARWLVEFMFSKRDDRLEKAAAAAKHFNDAAMHKSHGRRIDRDEARSVGVIVDDLEDDQALQDAVLTLYHLVTLSFEKGPATKLLYRTHEGSWVKNWIVDPGGQQIAPGPQRPGVPPGVDSRQQRRDRERKKKK